jgi:hypothetical protein
LFEGASFVALSGCTIFGEIAECHHPLQARDRPSRGVRAEA